jgi:hypothetical protein
MNTHFNSSVQFRTNSLQSNQRKAKLTDDLSIIQNTNFIISCKTETYFSLLFVHVCSRDTIRTQQFTCIVPHTHTCRLDQGFLTFSTSLNCRYFFFRCTLLCIVIKYKVMKKISTIYMNANTLIFKCSKPRFCYLTSENITLILQLNCSSITKFHVVPVGNPRSRLFRGCGQ